MRSCQGQVRPACFFAVQVVRQPLPRFRGLMPRAAPFWCQELEEYHWSELALLITQQKSFGLLSAHHIFNLTVLFFLVMALAGCQTKQVKTGSSANQSN